MAALPYIQFYPTDYLIDTAHLTLEEHGAYLLLILNYWQRGRPLPLDDKKLSGICRASVEQWLNMRSTLLDFFDEVEGELVHNRIEIELAGVRSKSTKASRAGKISAAKRAESKGKSNTRSTPVPQPFNHTDTDTDTDTVKPKIKRLGRFTPPTLEEVTVYCDQRKGEGKPPIEPETFIDHYTANGWVQGKGKPIKCWKSCVRTWEKSPRRHETPKREIGAKRNERIRKELARSGCEGTGDNRGYVPLLPSSEEAGS
jgi:uncharacterized protein YdaU (DUF1376 family)